MTIALIIMTFAVDWTLKVNYQIELSNTNNHIQSRGYGMYEMYMRRAMIKIMFLSGYFYLATALSSTSLFFKEQVVFKG